MDSRVILLAEDREDDIFAIRKILRDAFLENPIQVVQDGEQAISYLAGAGKFGDRFQYPLPALLLLDLRMPRKDGFEVLAWVRAQPQFRTLPVIVLTSSEDLRDVKRAYQTGATSFLLKPLGLHEARELAEFLPVLSSLESTPPETQTASHTQSGSRDPKQPGSRIRASD